SYQFFYPNERRVYPIYEVCRAAGIPVLLHIGSSVIAGTRLKYCDPIHLDDVAADFPDLSIVMAHGGRGFWYDACAFLAAHFRNVYIDVTGLVPEKLLEFFPAMEKFADKYVFGTDWPAMPKSAAHNIEAISRLGLSTSALERIFYQNAARLLKL
ncbi:MAG TPA: amidohydrolase family protein, partial [Longimicrobiales bacterium]